MTVRAPVQTHVEPAGGDRSGAWNPSPGLGVYVHVPFCRHRCHYCDFNTYEGLDALHGPYVDALCASISASSHSGPPASSVFFGGGTPTLLAPHDLGRILAEVRSAIGLTPDAEITVEANPETVDEAIFEGLLTAGFNRVSVGIQSFVPSVLTGLGREHPVTVAREALRAARAAGVPDLNADLIYGSPWEGPEDWEVSLEAVVETGVDHVSAYALTVEEATPLHTLVRTGRVADVDPDVQADRYERAVEVLGAGGYGRYEVSNWARPGRASRHNVTYWSAGNYLGFGAGAHGHVDGRRYWNERLPRTFIERVAAGASTEAGHEILSGGRRAPEALMLGLRLGSGVAVKDFVERFGPEHLRSKTAEIAALKEGGWLVEEEGRLRLTSRSVFLANDVIARLI